MKETFSSIDNRIEEMNNLYSGNKGYFVKIKSKKYRNGDWRREKAH